MISFRSEKRYAQASSNILDFQESWIFTCHQ